jgi:hypothetical protein
VEIHEEIPLNIDLEINNERQDYKISTMERVSVGDEGEDIWLMGFIHTHEIK